MLRTKTAYAHWLNPVEKHRFKFSETLFKRSGSAPAQIWKSRISWRIALSVFLTILIVQVGILYVTWQSYEQELLSDIHEIGRTAITSAVNTNVTDPLVSPIDDETARRIVKNTLVNGVSVYSSIDGQILFLKSFGDPLSMVMVDYDSLNQTFRSGNGDSYEVIYRISDTHFVGTRLDSSNVMKDVYAYIERAIFIMLTMSGFVTVVLMIALGHWLLEPVLFMRGNLIAASENPENPAIEDSPYDPGDEIGGAIVIAQSLIRQNAENIMQVKSAAEDKIHKLAYYDTLTGLPNRTLFIQSLSEKAHAQSPDGKTQRFAVVALDLDYFKDINDSMGHNIGDAILRGVGKRLRQALPESAIVARSGEDEFAIMAPLTASIASAKDVASKAASVIRTEPFKVFNENFQIRASIGVSTFPDDGMDPDQVLKNADIALNRAKEEGRDTVKEYSEDYDRDVQQRFQMLRDLRDALENNELLLYYQPQFDLKTGQVIGAEALIRWWRPDNSKDGGTFVSPGEFIPVAEQSGLIVPIGEWVMRHACETAVEWHKKGHNIRIAVNVSGAQFYQSDLASETEKILNETGLPAGKLELEVTESVFMDDIQHAINTLQNLHSLGVELAIDDFGTGYSSLSYLRQFPIDRLKIDQSFIRNALNNPDDASIARTIVRLGHSLNLKVIAEGVETIEHESFLKAEDCDEVQGFRYSKPIPNDDFVQFIESYNDDLSSFSKV